MFKNVYWTFQGGASFVDPFCYLCFVSVILSFLFLAALWSPAGKRATSWLFCMYCVLITFPHGVLGQVCYLIVSIPDLCLLPYSDTVYHNILCNKLKLIGVRSAK